MPAGQTYEPIETTTLSSSQASVTFSSFSGYTDLVLVCSIISVSTPGGQSSSLQFNSDTGSNYSYTRFGGSGTATTSGHSLNNTLIYLSGNGDASTTTPSTTITHIMNYSNTTTHKTVLSRGSWSGTSKETDIRVGVWHSTSAITSIKISAYAANFASGSTFTLYGIAAA